MTALTRALEAVSASVFLRPAPPPPCRWSVAVSSLSPKAALVYTTLLRHAGADVARIEGLAWAAVRLDAVRLDSMSAHAFAGCLRALERAGLYRSNYDDAYGLVRLPSDASVI